ncbi:MAG: tetratricopeptide repeat protein [Pseudomonadota bacterium]
MRRGSTAQDDVRHRKQLRDVRSIATVRVVVVASLSVVASACSTAGVLDKPGLLNEQAHPATEFAKAKAQFADGNFGKAVKLFEAGIERDAKDAEGWLGLAAAYDQTGRFDLADKAYGRTRELLGDTPTILNNQGYSYLLRGDLKRARRYLVKAALAEPTNPHIQNNIELLNDTLARAGQPTVILP